MYVMLLELLIATKPKITSCLLPLTLLGTLEMKQISKMSSLSVVKANLPTCSIFFLLTRWWPLVSVTIMFTCCPGASETSNSSQHPENLHAVSCDCDCLL